MSKFKPYIYSPQWKDALRLEHDIAVICNEMSDNGFYFDIDKAKALHHEVCQRLEALDAELLTAFPPKVTFVREVTPRATKHGTLHRGDFKWWGSPDLTPFEVGCAFSIIDYEPFNPASPKQIVERLNDAGWQPFEKTKGHIFAERARAMAARTGKPQPTKSGKLRTLAEWEEQLAHYETYGWSISEDNLATLPHDAPEPARKLVERLTLANRRSTLEEWFAAYSEADGRIHGTFNHIGAWTHRMSHAGPNMANIPASPSLYAHEMRSMWCVPQDKYLVGVDADSIQLRILAHYMDDPLFTEALVNGQKEDGTDAHSMNQRALGGICKSRDDAKTFIYAWLLGAGTAKIAQILGCSQAEAREASQNFLDAYPGLKFLKDRIIPDDAERGYFTGIDGRLVLCQTEHLMLAGYLQNGESVVMKRANVLWRRRLIEERIDFKQVNFVHDEWQTEVLRDMKLATYVANIQADSIRIVGEQLKLRCPLAGSIIGGNKKLAIGDNWEMTH
jgi:DNA polymerase-1